MKQHLLFFFLFLGINASAGGLDTLVVKTKIYCDHCAKCESCQPFIEQELNYTKGIRRSEVDPVAMTITVYYKVRKISPEEIRKVITKAGFAADGQEPDPQGYENLDGCCKKK